MQLALGIEPESSNFEITTKIFSDRKITYRVGEFWTSKQRQANPIHEISYRACFKPQLPDYFISRFTKQGDLVYDPFGGRGTTAIQAGISGRRVIQNDINPLSTLLTKPRLAAPDLGKIETRLNEIAFNKTLASSIDLSMFYHQDTLIEILSMREYFAYRQREESIDEIDQWISMVATNRLTGHSSGFFSVYSFPPNQAVSQNSQKRINLKRKQVPTYRNTRDIIMRKSKSLQSKLSQVSRLNLRNSYKDALFLSKPADQTSEILDQTVQLTVTSPPFLDIVQYSEDNWLRCWFNSLNTEEISNKVTVLRDVTSWGKYMKSVMEELFRITKVGGYVAFEVGEVRNQTVKLDEIIVPIALSAGFDVEEVMVNLQHFTKTSNLWGVANNTQGTNTNRIVVMKKS